MILKGIGLLLLGAFVLGTGLFMLVRPRGYQRYLLRSYEKSGHRRWFWREWAYDRVSSRGYLIQIMIMAPFVTAFGLLILWGAGTLLNLW